MWGQPKDPYEESLRVVVNGLNVYAAEMGGESAEAARITAVALNKQYEDYKREVEVTDHLIENTDRIMGQLQKLFAEYAEVLGPDLTAEFEERFVQMKDIRDALATPLDPNHLPDPEEHYANTDGFVPWRSARQMLAELTYENTTK